jgi:iron uptake system EfeUOB component EfeO/EfeM
LETVDIGWLERAGAAFVTVDEVIANFATGQGFHSFSEISEEDLRSLQARMAGQFEVLADLPRSLGLEA